MSELKDILEVNDFSLVLVNPNNIQKTPSRAIIETVLTDNGYSLPLNNSVSFVIISNNRAHTVRYGKIIDSFYTILMEPAV